MTVDDILLKAFLGRYRIPGLPDEIRPRTLPEAYACQDAVVERLLQELGGTVAGYKAACTNAIAQKQLGVDGPYCGRLLSALVHDSPAKLDPSRFFMRVVEAEFAFVLGEDLPAIDRLRTRDEVGKAVAGVLPAIEVVDSRYEDWTKVGAASLISDHACNAAWIKGTPLADWRHLDLASQPVKVFVNGKLEKEGSGAAVLGHPLEALKWLVNQLASRGIGVRRGEYFTTGVTTAVYMGEPGDKIVADFKEVGTVELSF